MLKSKEPPITTDENSAPPQQPSTKIKRALRRDRVPPRDEQGQMYCDHVECTGQTQTFKRVCDWNKHMDRHQRPYKCFVPGCELNPGFTYSGGLLRHQREVHKMHLSTKQPLFCPFPNCNRSSGAGFTRKENLEEHKRRRHLEELSNHAPNRAVSQPLAPSTTISEEPPAKRRKFSPAADARTHEPKGEVVDEQGNDGFSESKLIQALRAEIRRKDEYILRQSMEIRRLSNLIGSIRPQTIYGVTRPQRGGAGVDCPRKWTEFH